MQIHVAVTFGTPTLVGLHEMFLGSHTLVDLGSVHLTSVLPQY